MLIFFKYKYICPQKHPQVKLNHVQIIEVFPEVKDPRVNQCLDPRVNDH